jgi:8-oxo-dGTP pyrophosphatase MutT (NUDIX family)
MTELPPCCYRISAKAVIINDGSILLVNEDGDGWDLPGGGWEHEETIEAALSREVMEELGVGVAHMQGPLDVFSLYVPRHGRHALHLLYRVELSSEDFSPGELVTQIAYVPLATLQADQLDEHLRPVADRYLAMLKKLANLPAS